MPSGYKKDNFGYYLDTAQGKLRIKKLAGIGKRNQWFVQSMAGIHPERFKTLTEALTWIKEGWHVL